MKTLNIGSSTKAQRAQDVLRRQGISAQIKRTDSMREGCVRGLRIEDGQVDRAMRILSENGITVRGITEAGR